MTTKQYLQQIYHITQRVARLQRTRDDLREAVQAIRECTGKFVLMCNSILAEEGRA